METHNIIEQLTSEEYELVVGEGTYKIRESILLATPPPHPSEAPLQPSNPLDTARKPPTAGTKLSLAIVGPKGAALAAQLKEQLLLQTRPATPDTDAGSQDTGSFIELGDGDNVVIPPVFGQDNPALSTNTTGKEPSAKKKKPKNKKTKKK